jgi:CHAT domain-containing protein
VPDLPDFPRLPAAREEIRRIHEMAHEKGISHLQLQDCDATTAAVRNALHNASWVHFSCHGSGGSKPFNSSLHLFDNPLYLSDIAQSHPPIADFAFLSACQTGSVLVDLPEECLHLAAGFQFIGFRSIIATMWSVHDKMATHIADGVYSRLWEDKCVDSSGSKAAEALDLTIRDLVTMSRPWLSELGRNVYKCGPLTTAEKAEIVDGRLIPFVHFGI